MSEAEPTSPKDLIPRRVFDVKHLIGVAGRALNGGVVEEDLRWKWFRRGAQIPAIVEYNLGWVPDVDPSSYVRWDCHGEPSSRGSSSSITTKTLENFEDT